MADQNQEPIKKSRKGYKPPADVSADRREIRDSNHRRIGFMWPEDFEAKLKATLGDGWIAKFCRESGFSRDTIDMYRGGRLPIPKHVALLVHHMRWYAMNKPKERVKRMPPLEADWLD